MMFKQRDRQQKEVGMRDKKRGVTGRMQKILMGSKTKLVEDEVMKEQDRARLFGAISALPEKQRRRLIYRFFDELSYREISEREGCSIRAVEYSVHEAIETLRKKLKNF